MTAPTVRSQRFLSFIFTRAAAALTLVWATTATALAAGGLFYFVANVPTNRQYAAAVTLTSGQALVIGGLNSAGSYSTRTDEYNPATNTWTQRGNLSVARQAPVATLLGDGRLLVTGGYASGGVPSQAADLYDPATRAYTALTMNFPHADHTATLLPDGTVLIVGGFSAVGTYGRNAEIYDPTAAPGSQFQTLTAMAGGRVGHTATRLVDGSVLIAGGASASGILYASFLTYHAGDRALALESVTAIGRINHTATLLDDGTVLLAGGLDKLNTPLASTAIYTPGQAGSVPAGPSLSVARFGHTATATSSGAFVVGGRTCFAATCAPNATADIYSNGVMTSTNMARGRAFHSATLLQTGSLLVSGGVIDATGTVTNLAEASAAPPTVNAGADQTLTSTLYGQATISVTGTATSNSPGPFTYEWTANGVSFGNTLTASATLSLGSFDIVLTVTDLGLGISASDHIAVLVQVPTIAGPVGPTGATGPKGEKGDTGDTGAAGVQGATGPTGATGATGEQGPKGDTGATGATGAAGATGAQGSKGDSGAAGVNGIDGAPGAKGDKGDAGVPGAIGATGATGATGAAGATGAQGSKGDAGAAGVNGIDGAPGAKGDKGDAGVPGATGAIGATGATGATGAAGATGAQGSKGDAGAAGVNGIDGAPGAKGDKGDAGVPGAIGATGATGAAGATGATGAQGSKGDAGPTGATGATGAKGDTGAVGPQGPSGTPAVSGTVLLLVEGAAAPVGYVRLGSYFEERVDQDGKGGKKPTNIKIVMWQKQ